MDNHKEEIEFLKAEIVKLEHRVQQLELRNSKVEKEKGWEVSSLRRISLMALTYLASAIIFVSIETPAPLLNALIPATAYGLSTLTLPVLRRLWRP